MSKALITESLLTDIADAIRSKLSSQDEYTPAEMAIAIDTISAGASNVVQGTFVGTTTGAAMDVSLGYTGSGYPVACVIWPDGGFVGNTTWYDAIQRYAIGMYAMTKSYESQTPTYTTSGAANQAAVLSRYKNSTSSATSFTNGSGQTVNTYSSSNATASSTTPVRFKSDGTMSVFIASTSYGFMAGVTYKYAIIYSS